MIIIANACRKFSLANIRFLLVVTLIYINERNIELYIPTDQLGRHVLMTEIYPTVLLGLPGHRWISKSLHFFNDVVVSKFGNGFKIIINCCELFRDVWIQSNVLYV